MDKSNLFRQCEENSRLLEKVTETADNHEFLNKLRTGLDKVTEGLRKRRQSGSDSRPTKKRKGNKSTSQETDYVKNWILTRRNGFHHETERFLKTYSDASNERTSSVTAYMQSIGYLSNIGKIKRVHYPTLTRDQWLKCEGNTKSENDFINLWCQATRIGTNSNTEEEENEVAQLMQALYKKYGASIPKREWSMIKRILAHLLPGKYRNQIGKLRFTNLIKQLCHSKFTCEDYWESMTTNLLAKLTPPKTEVTPSSNTEEDDEQITAIPWSSWLKFERDFIKELTVDVLTNFFDTDYNNEEQATEIFGLPVTTLRAHHRWFQTMEISSNSERRKRINRIFNDRCTENMRILLLRESSFLDLLRNVLPHDEILEDILIQCDILPYIKNIHYTFDATANEYHHKVDQKSKQRQYWFWCFTNDIKTMIKDENLRQHLITDAGLLKCRTLEDAVRLDSNIANDGLVFSGADDIAILTNYDGNEQYYRATILAEKMNKGHYDMPSFMVSNSAGKFRGEENGSDLNDRDPNTFETHLVGSNETNYNNDESSDPSSCPENVDSFLRTDLSNLAEYAAYLFTETNETE